jgi:hypothetical protein
LKKSSFFVHTTIVVTINVELNKPPRDAGAMVKFAPRSRDHVPIWKKNIEIFLKIF